MSNTISIISQKTIDHQQEKAVEIVSIKVDRKSLPDASELKAMVKSSKGKFFSCKTLKDDGSVRHWVARVGVKKGVKGNSTRKQKDNLVTVFDVKINSFRNIDVNKLLSYSCGNFEFSVE